MRRVWVQLTRRRVRMPGAELAVTDYVVTPNVAGGFHHHTGPRQRRTVLFRGRVGVVTHIPTGLRCSDPLPWAEAQRQAGWWGVWGPQGIRTTQEALGWAVTHQDVLALLEIGLNPGMLFERPTPRFAH